MTGTSLQTKSQSSKHSLSHTCLISRTCMQDIHSIIIILPIKHDRRKRYPHDSDLCLCKLAQPHVAVGVHLAFLLFWSNHLISVSSSITSTIRSPQQAMRFLQWGRRRSCLNSYLLPLRLILSSFCGEGPDIICNCSSAIEIELAYLKLTFLLSQ